MGRFAEVKIQISATVLVEVENHETIEDAIQYASDEYSNVDGDVTASCKGFIVSGGDIESAKRHSNINLTLN